MAAAAAAGAGVRTGTGLVQRRLAREQVVVGVGVVEGQAPAGTQGQGQRGVHQGAGFQPLGVGAAGLGAGQGAAGPVEGEH